MKALPAPIKRKKKIIQPFFEGFYEEEVPVEENQVKPLLKWVGSKSRYVGQFVDEIKAALRPDSVYVEPFCGSLSVFLAVNHPQERCYLSDASDDLISLYCGLAREDSLRKIKTDIWVLSSAETTRGRYLRIKEDFRKEKKNILGTIESRSLQAARMIWLNKTCFNGLWRVNAKGEFNAAYGLEWNNKKAGLIETRKPSFPTTEEVLAFAARIKDTWIARRDFEKTINLDFLKPGDVIYADPPYDGATYDGYAGAFKAEDQQRLVLALWEAWKRGIKVFASNFDTPFVREAYGQFCTFREIKTNHAIGGHAERRRGNVELFISSK